MKNLFFVLVVFAFSFASLNTHAQRVSACSGQTFLLYTTTPYANQINLGITSNGVKFYTNRVCNATSYSWTIGGGPTVTTSNATVTLDADDFLFFPAGLCEEFNASISNGSYYTTITVKSNLSSSITIPVVISGVDKCKIGFPQKPKLEVKKK
mgnify:CR=1 FL=1